MLDVKKVPITIFIDMPDMSGKYKAFLKWKPLHSLLACIRGYQAYASSKNILNRIFLKRVAVLRCYFWSTVYAGIGANSLDLQNLPAGKSAVVNLASIIN
jgi:hypothetical protein